MRSALWQTASQSLSVSALLIAPPKLQGIRVKVRTAGIIFPAHWVLMFECHARNNRGSNYDLNLTVATATEPLLRPISIRARPSWIRQVRPEVLQLGKAVLHRQYRLGVVEVYTGSEPQAWYGSCIDVDQAQRRMTVYEMATAFRAVLAVAHPCLHEVPDKPGPLFDLQVLRLPQGEGIHRRGRPGSARAAMAIAHCHRRSIHLDMRGTTEALALKRRHNSPQRSPR